MSDGLGIGNNGKTHHPITVNISRYFWIWNYGSTAILSLENDYRSVRGTVQAVIHTMRLPQPDLWLKGTSDNSCAPWTLEPSAFLFSPREEDDQAIAMVRRHFSLVWAQVTFGDPWILVLQDKVKDKALESVTEVFWMSILFFFDPVIVLSNQSCHGDDQWQELMICWMYKIMLELFVFAVKHSK